MAGSYIAFKLDELRQKYAGAESPYNEFLRRRDGRDRVELERAQRADRRAHVRRRPVEQLGADRDPPGLGDRHRPHRRTVSSPITRRNRSSARSSASSRAAEARTPGSRWKARTTSVPDARSDLRSARPTMLSPRRNGST